jgi:hypothetical protein
MANTPPNKIQEFFTDPRNLATGLVFLAALAQPRSPGQSTAGAIGERAVGALGFRGGLDKGIRAQREKEEETAARRLEESRADELRRRQVTVQEQGLGLQREQLTQADRLAKEQRDLTKELATTVRPETPEEAELKRQMAGYYGRMPASTGRGGSESDLRTKILEDLSRIRWEQENQQAALEGRQPDYSRVLADVVNFSSDLMKIPPGAKITRQADGTFGISLPGDSDPTAPPGSEPVPLTPHPSEVPPPITDIGTAAVLSQPTKPRTKSRTSTGVGQAVAQQDTAALEKLDEQQLLQIIKNPRVSKDIQVRARQELRGRRTVEALQRGGMEPGMR